MKSDIHPKYYPDAKVTCTCGNSFTTGSTLPEIHVDICSKCHPFFTGEMKFVDTQGRVEKFEALRQKASKIQSTLKKTKKVSNQDETSDDDNAKTLKEMMVQISKQQGSPESKTKDSKPSPKPTSNTSPKQ